MLQTVLVAERVLTNVFGGPVRLGTGSDLEGSERSKVLRLPVVEGPAGTPETVIVKQVNSEAFHPDAGSEEGWGFFNDWASLQFLQQIAGPGKLAPVFYGGDRRSGLFVMEDLGERTRLDHLLLGSDAGLAEAGLLAYAEAHGRLHALGIGRQQEYRHIREALSSDSGRPAYFTYDWLFPALTTITRLLDLPVHPGAEAELAELTSALLDPGPFLSFVQSDAAPDNCLLSDQGLMLIDFEAGRYTHALLEGVYCRMPFPTCWCVYRMPEPVMRRAEAAYRAELAKGCPAASDETTFYHAVTEVCVMWALSFTVMMRPLEKMLNQDRYLTALTDRQRFLLYVQAALTTTESFGHLPATGSVLRAILHRLTQLWPEAVDPPYYPAFS